MLGGIVEVRPSLLSPRSRTHGDLVVECGILRDLAMERHGGRSVRGSMETRDHVLGICRDPDHSRVGRMVAMEFIMELKREAKLESDELPMAAKYL